MIEKNNAVLSADELMGKIREQIEGSTVASLLRSVGGAGLPGDITTLVAGIEDDLIAAEIASRVRTSIGRTTHVLGRSRTLQSLFLRALAFIFRDQRNVNAALAAALRKSLQLNIRLAEQYDLLTSRMAALEEEPRNRRAKRAP